MALKMTMQSRILCSIICLIIQWIAAVDSAVDVTMVIPQSISSVQVQSQIKCVANDSYDAELGVEVDVGAGDSIPEESIADGIEPEDWPGIQATMSRDSGVKRYGIFYCSATEKNNTNVTTKVVGTILPSSAQSFPSRFIYTTSVGQSLDLKMIQPKPAPYKDLMWVRLAPGRPRQFTSGRLEVNVPEVDVDLAGVYIVSFPLRDLTRRLYKQGLFRIIVRPCDEKRYGDSCQYDCTQCKNGGICDLKDGSCICPPGFGGPTCEKLCGYNKFGAECQHECKINGTERGCLGKQFCLPDPYGCSCATGFIGLMCNYPCSEGKYGVNCEQECHCMNNKDCDLFTGKCGKERHTGCSSGWTGENCQEHCPPYKHGPDCAIICGSCYGDLSCNGVTGVCPGANSTEAEEGSGMSDDVEEDKTYYCDLRYKPPDCKEFCQDETWGRDCLKECHCLDGVGCNAITGKCPSTSSSESGCAPGWRGDTCDETCGSGTFGFNCEESCGRCANNSACHHISGACDEPGLKDELCEPGYVAPNCTNFCQEGKFGFNCSVNCNCANGTMCQPVDGSCSGYCAPGYTGLGCQELCPPGTYGLNCTLKCGNCLKTNDEIRCEGERGICTNGCSRGWEGERCNKGTLCAQNPCKNNGSCEQEASIYKCICIHGYVGSHCELKQPPCFFTPCKNDGICIDNADRESYTCQCAANYTGKECEVSMESLFGELDDKEEVSHFLGPIVAGAVLGALLLAALAVFILWKKCRPPGVKQNRVTDSCKSFHKTQTEGRYDKLGSPNFQKNQEDSESGVLECDGSSQGCPTPDLEYSHSSTPESEKAQNMSEPRTKEQNTFTQKRVHSSNHRAESIRSSNYSDLPQVVTMVSGNRKISVTRKLSGSVSDKSGKSSSPSVHSKSSMYSEDLNKKPKRLSSNSLFEFYSEPTSGKRRSLVDQFNAGPRSLSSKRKDSETSSRFSDMSVGGCAVEGEGLGFNKDSRADVPQRISRNENILDSPYPGKTSIRKISIGKTPAGMSDKDCKSLITEVRNADEEFEMEIRRGSLRVRKPSDPNVGILPDIAEEDGTVNLDVELRSPKSTKKRKKSRGRSLSRISEEGSSLCSPKTQRSPNGNYFQAGKANASPLKNNPAQSSDRSVSLSRMSETDNVNSMLRAIEAHANLMTNVRKEHDARKRRSIRQRPSAISSSTT
ncbi:uncharacterized protein LOC144427337 [Styela clava]